MRDPLLAETTYTHAGTRYRLRVHGGLHYLRGNRTPYFSLTADQDRAEGGYWREDCGGCCHDLIEARFPGRFTDLAALHLSDIYGAPSHDGGNGWYFLAGACGGLGERYHFGNSKGQHWKGTPDAVGQREFDGYRESTPAECLQTFADYVRVSIEEAERIRAACLAAAVRDTPLGPYHVPALAKAVWLRECEGMRARWSEEARACIAAHGLKLYGGLPGVQADNPPAWLSLAPRAA